MSEKDHHIFVVVIHQNALCGGDLTFASAWAQGKWFYSPETLVVVRLTIFVSSMISNMAGIEVPHAYLMLDTTSCTTTLYLPCLDAKMERSEGAMLSVEDEEVVKQLTGVTHVKARESLKGDLQSHGTAAASTLYSECLYLQAPPA